MKKRTIIYVVSVIVIIFVVIILFLQFKGKKEVRDILSINLREHKNLALHIHPYLEIEVLGEKQVIPANIGISPHGMRVIHTHDTTGKLHIESPYPHQFYLKDFFKVWDRRLNSTCIFEFCEDEKHRLKFFVNGVENNQKDSIPLRDADIIKVSYERVNTTKDGK